MKITVKKKKGNKIMIEKQWSDSKTSSSIIITEGELADLVDLLIELQNDD